MRICARAVEKTKKITKVFAKLRKYGSFPKKNRQESQKHGKLPENEGKSRRSGKYYRNAGKVLHKKGKLFQRCEAFWLHEVSKDFGEVKQNPAVMTY